MKRNTWMMLPLAAATLISQGVIAQTADAGKVSVRATNSAAHDGEGWSAPLESVDIGSPAIAGSTQTSSNGLEVKAAGADIWNASDQFRFVHQRQTGDFDVAVRVSSLTGPHLYSRAGIMAREDLSSGSRHVYFLVFADNKPRHNNTSAYEFQYREKKDGDSAAIYPPAASGGPMFPVSYPDVWLRLQREGNEFTSFISVDGHQWKKYSSYTAALPQTLYLGLAVTSHDAEGSATATFDHLERVKK